MRKYCKAYYLKDIRRFPNWSGELEEETQLSDDTVVYLWEDLTVVKSPVLHNKGILWSKITPEWQQFCKTVLSFEIPKELGYTYE